MSRGILVVKLHSLVISLILPLGTNPVAYLFPCPLIKNCHVNRIFYLLMMIYLWYVFLL